MEFKDIITHFGEDKIKKRCENLYMQMSAYSSMPEYKNKLSINQSILQQVVLDYFVDVYRLKQMHEINNINEIKIHSYMAYWILKRKPMQISDESDACFANEDFICTYLLRFLYQKNNIQAPIDDLAVTNFISTLRYSLRYRELTAQNIQLILEAFCAGFNSKI